MDAADTSDNANQTCESIPFVDGDKVTASKEIVFEGAANVTDGVVVLSPGTSVTVTLRVNVTLLYVYGQVAPSFGEYEAAILGSNSTGMSTGKVTGSAQRATNATEALYYVMALFPLLSGYQMVLTATDFVALEYITVCYST